MDLKLNPGLRDLPRGRSQNVTRAIGATSTFYLWPPRLTGILWAEFDLIGLRRILHGLVMIYHSP